MRRPIRKNSYWKAENPFASTAVIKIVDTNDQYCAIQTVNAPVSVTSNVPKEWVRQAIDLGRLCKITGDELKQVKGEENDNK